jgi:hypothetical protein
MSGGSGIARLEWTRAWRDPVMRVMLILFALVSGYAALSGALGRSPPSRGAAGRY